MTTRPDPVSHALTPSFPLHVLLARREQLRESIVDVRASYDEMKKRSGGLLAGFSAPMSEYTLALQWSKTNRDLDDDDHIEMAFKRVDAACWSFALAASGLEQLMDHTARKEWRKSLDDLTMPEFNEDNVLATFSKLHSERGEIFERGVVEVFRKLSWKYRANSPVKFGKRLIITCASESHTFHHEEKNGHLVAKRTYLHVWGPSHEFADKLDDLIRVFCVLEGKPEPSHDQGAWHTINNGGWMKGDYDPGVTPEKRDFELHGYIRFRGFKNRNAHLTFLRPDLVDALNRIVSKHFPNALPPSSEDDSV